VAAFAPGYYMLSSTAAQRPRAKPSLAYRVENTIRERGAVESVRLTEIRCQVAGGSTLLFLAEEGKRVEKGDLLVELDDALLREQLAAAEIQFKKSQAELDRRKFELRGLRREHEARQRLAEMEARAADLARKRELDDGGEWAMQLSAANSELAIAKQRLKVAQDVLENAPGNRGGKSVVDLRLMVFEARETMKVAESRKRFLEQHDREYRTALLDLAVAKKQLQVLRIQTEAESAIRLSESELQAVQASCEQVQLQLANIKRQIENCKLVAPQAGLVMHPRANTGRTNRTAVLEEGAQVRERQTLILLPDMTDLRLRVFVNESRISRVAVGQPATIRCDAFPDREWSGKVTHISDQPEPSSWFAPDIKRYAVFVSIEGPTEQLKIGLTALVEIDAGMQPD
jgi:HlyD family secretion protein